jgi:hypothetical protein
VAFVRFVSDVGGMPRCCTGGAAAAVLAGLVDGTTGHVGTAVRLPHPDRAGSHWLRDVSAGGAAH